MQFPNRKGKPHTGRQSVAVASRGRTYDNPSLPPPPLPLPPPAPIAAGYTKNHPQYNEQNKVWSRKAHGAKEEVSIKVIMGHVPPGKRNIRQIGVSNDTLEVCLCAHTGITGCC